ncbi:MAG: MmcQ/YjbR family DNA-binding protein [Proteobacteria bacterium]|nr:MmcQ/YjbR family DNA-binding protein [Pseudomonadota bacterium]
MTYKDVEEFLKSLGHTTMVVQWGDHHVYKIGGKVFAVVGGSGEAEPGLTFKAGETSFAILTKQKGIIQAPYMARNQWVKLERLPALKDSELKAYLERSYHLIASGLTKKMRISLGFEEAPKPKAKMKKKKA